MITALILMCTADMSDCYSLNTRAILADAFACKVSIEELVNSEDFMKKYVIIDNKQYLPVDYSCVDWTKGFYT